MKRVLLIDASPIFEDFLNSKLKAEQILVETAESSRDAYAKLITMLPDLVIINVEESLDVLNDFFEQKLSEANAKRVPVMISGPEIPRQKIASLVQYGVVKYFNKPIKFDVFFDSIGKILKTNLSLDTTPCVLEMHVNRNIIFVEIAQGLNREKIALLKYRLTETIDKNKISNPKIILMMTALTLTFIDGANLELLIDNVRADERVTNDNIKILSLDNFTHELVEGHSEYAGIEVATNLNDILNNVVDNSNRGENAAELVSDMILDADRNAEQGSVEMRFNSDTEGVYDSKSTTGGSLLVAVVDEDQVVRGVIATAFAQIGLECIPFENGKEFMDAVSNKKDFDLIIMDINQPDMNGMDLLKYIQTLSLTSPIIVYSAVNQRETVIEALSSGAKSYLCKPQKPDVILKKAVELLHHSA